LKNLYFTINGSTTNSIISFFPTQIFRRPWADFRETLSHSAVCPAFYLVYACPLKI